MRSIVRRRLEEIDRRVQEMLQYRDELSATLEEWERVGRMPGHICGLIEDMGIEKGIPGASRNTGQLQLKPAKSRR